MARDPIITYGVKVNHGGYDLRIDPPESDKTTPHRYAYYDDYPTDSSVIVANCNLYISYSNVQWTINNDNSITVTGNIEGGTLVRNHTGASSSQKQEITATFNGQTTFHSIINTASSGTYDLNIPRTFSVTIPPSYNPTPQGPAAIHFINDNTTVTSPPDDYELGILITNPNPPDYRPGAVLSEGKWLSHNRSGGEAHILKADGKWKEMRTADGHSTNNNPPSIRIGNKWTDQKKIGKE